MSAAGPALLDAFTPSEVLSIEIKEPDGGIVSIARGPIEGSWLLSPSADQPKAFVESSRVQGFLRLLSELRVGPSDGRPMPRAAIATLLGKNGPIAILAFDPELLAGRGRVALLSESGAVARVAVTTEDLAALVRPEAVAEWRQRSLLPWAQERSNSVLLLRGDRRVEMSRLGSGWMMTAPIQMRADAGTAPGVALWLSNATIDRFLSGSDGADSFAKPVRTIAVGTEALDRRRIEQRIELGGELDARSSVVRITGVDLDSGRPLWGPSIAVVQTSLLAGLSDDPSTYLPRTAFDFPSADVVAVRVGTVTVARGGDGGFGELDATVRALLRLLTEVRSPNVSLLPAAPTPGAEAVPVTLLGLGGATIGFATLEYESIAPTVEGTTSTPAIRVTVDSVRRVIPLERAREFLAAVKSIGAVK